MFYKVLPNTETHAKLEALKAKKIQCERLAEGLAVSFVGTAFSKASMYIGGGIGIVRMPVKRKGWCKAVHKDCYYPGFRAQKDKIAIDALPKVEYMELNEILGYTEFTRGNAKTSGSLVTFCPTFYWYKNDFIFKVHQEDPYCPSNTDIQEITRSEYEAIVNAKTQEG